MIECPEGGCGLQQGDGCCSECCEGPCAVCAFDPCEGYECDDNPNYTCQANYCNGCNRQWVRESGGDLVHCFNERLSPPHTDNCLDTFCPMIFLDCPCGKTTVDCCPACCDCENNCEHNPCDLVTCLSNSEFECRPNYCDGSCRHEWFDADGSPVRCTREIFDTITAPDWETGCKHDWECSLRNVDNNFACCDEGMCDPIDYETDSWIAVNDQWWQARHDECSMNCGDIQPCPTGIRDIPGGPTSISAAVCVARHCLKVEGANASLRPEVTTSTSTDSERTFHAVRQFSFSDIWSHLAFIDSYTITDPSTTRTFTSRFPSFTSHLSDFTDSIASMNDGVTQAVTDLFSTMTSLFFP